MKSLLFVLLIGSCTHAPTRLGPSDSPKEAPEWLYSPYANCIEVSEFCATGEGKNYSQSDAQAKVNLASIFEVKIQSETSIHTSSSQSFPWQSQVREEVQKSLQESVDQVLETVQIKNHFRKDGISHSLASLNRGRASELFGDRLSKVDQELSVLWKKKQRTNLRRIFKLYLERERLNERYSIVAGGARPAPVSWESVVKWRETRPQAEPLILKFGQAPDWMKEKIEELLTEAGFKLKTGDANKVVAVQVDSIKEFMNVDGFEKYTFTLNMTSFENGSKNKVISTSETVTGRNQADALLKVKTLFTEYIEQHLSDLNLD